jgi:hypothetical protein
MVLVQSLSSLGSGFEEIAVEGKAMTTKTNRIVRYYDTHEVEGEELSQSWEHFAAIEYLIAVLKWLFQGRKAGIGSNINLYQTIKPREKPKSPDVMVIDELVVEELDKDSTTSYYVGEDGPPPRVLSGVGFYIAKS